VTRIPCPLCKRDVSNVETNDEGQVTCPDCFSYFPRQWASNLNEFEQECERRLREKRERSDG